MAILRRVVDYRGTCLPASSVLSFSCLLHFTYFNSLQGKYDEAGPLYERSLAIREKTLGPDHPDVAESMNNRAVLLDNQVNALREFYSRNLMRYGVDEDRSFGWGRANERRRCCCECSSASVDYIGHIARAYSPDHVSVQIGSCPLPSHGSSEFTCR